jgi:heat shock transcription factor
MMYYNNLPTTSAGPAGNIFASDQPGTMPSHSQGDIYRHQGTPIQSDAIYGPHDATTQIARVSRGNQLVRMPSFNGMQSPGIPQQISGLGTQIPMNMNLMGGPGMMGLPAGFDQPVGAPDALDRDLYIRIENMKKKRASIPPFVLKLSR